MLISNIYCIIHCYSSETMNDTKGENDDHTEQNQLRNDDEFSPVGDVDQLVSITTH